MEKQLARPLAGTDLQHQQPLCRSHVSHHRGQKWTEMDSIVATAAQTGSAAAQVSSWSAQRLRRFRPKQQRQLLCTATSKVQQAAGTEQNATPPCCTSTRPTCWACCSQPFRCSIYKQQETGINTMPTTAQPGIAHTTAPQHTANQCCTAHWSVSGSWQPPRTHPKQPHHHMRWTTLQVWGARNGRHNHDPVITA